MVVEGIVVRELALGALRGGSPFALRDAARLSGAADRIARTLSIKGLSPEGELGKRPALRLRVSRPRSAGGTTTLGRRSAGCPSRGSNLVGVLHEELTLGNASHACNRALPSTWPQRGKALVGGSSRCPIPWSCPQQAECRFRLLCEVGDRGFRTIEQVNRQAIIPFRKPLSDVERTPHPARGAETERHTHLPSHRGSEA